MKFTDGYWHLRSGVTAAYAQEAYKITADDDALVITAPSKVIAERGNVLNLPVLTVTLSAPAEGIIKVRVEHHTGGRRSPGFELNERPGSGKVSVTEADATLTSGALRAVLRKGSPWSLEFFSGERRLTGAGHRSFAHMTLAPGAPVAAEPSGIAGVTATGLAPASAYSVAQLDLGVGELIYGLGERFGAFVKNGQTVDIWNADGGTSSEMAYKNVPFYLSSRGYGVLVNQPEHVSFEVGTEAVERVQFSTAGEAVEFLIIDGPTPTEVIDRYTALTGRPANVPAWSYGLWLSTSFTTDYDEATVNSFVDGMREHEIPLSAFHFDCFWMEEFQWTDLTWDARTFPDPKGMLHRLHEQRGLNVCVWINPYIAQNSVLFKEAADAGYLVKRADGTVWQWDWWVAGMGLVDFTNPGAVIWFQDQLRRLIGEGVDAFKTDFGERIPTDVVWHNGADPQAMHNLYTQLYNKAVFEVLTEEKGAGQAVLFARSATAGGQQFPIHWGGDNTSTFESMAETLRGGLSLASSGFGFWSHDIGGFEGLPDPAVFKRWLAFGLLSSHSRLHASNSYRVPWQFDDEAVEVTRRFARLKNSLMPYLWSAGRVASATGVSVARPLFFDFPDDPAVGYLDRQYMLGPDILVAPVFTPDGAVDFYLPAGVWTSLLTGESVEGGRWLRQTHPLDSLPVYVRPGAVLARGLREDRPDYDFIAELELVVYPGGPDQRSVTVCGTDGEAVTFSVTVDGQSVTATGPSGPVRARLA